LVTGEHLVLSDDGVTLEDIERIGRRLGGALRAGDLVLLEGPLGAGKTTLVRAVAEALEVTDPVRSPSFTLANIYAGRMLVHHLDLYRLEHVDEADALALEDYGGETAVTLVEWPEAGLSALGDPTWRVRMDHESPSTRRLEIWAVGEGARVRWEEADADE